MKSIRNLALTLIVTGVISIPMYAESITWTFDDTTATSMGNAGIQLSDGSTLTGSFTYTCAAANGGNCDGVGNSNPLGDFSNVNITVSGGTIIPSGQTWYINEPSDDTGSDAQSIFLVNYNPATTPDGTNVDGQPCPVGNAANACDPGYLIALSIGDDPQIGFTSNGMDDSGGVYLLNNGAPPQSGYCVTAECTSVNSSPGFYANAETSEADLTGHIWANAYVPPPPPTSGTPEPATLALAGAALLGLGFARRKFSARS